MQDNFSALSDSVISPSRSAFAVTPHDSNPLARLPKALYVGTGGQITLRCIDDTTDVVFKNVPSGSLVHARAAYVRATGTTAADLVAHC
jgi:hypothetical protein